MHEPLFFQLRPMRLHDKAWRRIPVTRTLRFCCNLLCCCLVLQVFGDLNCIAFRVHIQHVMFDASQNCTGGECFDIAVEKRSRWCRCCKVQSSHQGAFSRVPQPVSCELRQNRSFIFTVSTRPLHSRAQINPSPYPVKRCSPLVSR